VHDTESIIACRQLFNAIFENTPVGVAMVDGEGRLMGFNHAFRNMLGYSNDELFGMTFRDITHESDKQEDIARFNEMLENRRDHSNIEKKYIKKDGSTITANLIVTAIRDSDGNFLYDIGMVEDITERKRSEELIQKTLKEKDILLKEIHHRVKNNMSVITSMLDLKACLLKDKKTAEVLEDLIGRIRAMSLVHERLYSSDNLEHINLRDYIKSLTDNLCRSFTRPDKAISTHIEAGEVCLGLDKLIPLGLLINELVTNSYKHAFNDTDKGEIKVCLKSHASGGITLKVGDNGCGLPPGKGLDDYPDSLGIRLVKALAAQLDGYVSVSSGKGTEFVFSDVA